MKKPVANFATFLLGVIAAGQATRLFLAWPIAINGIDIPLWPSGVAAVLAGTTAVLLWREARR